MAHVSARARKTNSSASSKLVYWRQNFDPQRDTPVNVQDSLHNWGGTNEYGESLWRVVLAENHLCLRDGMWTNRDENRDTVVFNEDKQNMRDGSMPYQNRVLAPESVTTGPQWVKLYPCKGWILERWFPAHCFGTKEAWEGTLSQDGFTPMMGPYPARGDYWLMKGPWNELPAMAEFRRGISSWENSTKHMHGNIDHALYEVAMKNFMKILEEQEEEQYMRVLGQATAMRKEFERDMGNPFLSAWKNQILNSRGMTSHY